MLLRFKIPSFQLCSTAFGKNLNVSNDTESDTEWERLLKPFDLKQLQRSLSPISPFQLCKLLKLPLDIPTSMEFFQRAGAQMGYSHTFDVYSILIDKLGAVGEFKVIESLLKQMKEEGVVFHESLFLLIMKHYGKAGLPGQAPRLLLDMRSVYSCEPTFKSYNVVLEILVAGGCPKYAPNVFYDMLSRGVSPTVFTFGVVMKALCMVNEVDSACSLLRDMTKHGCVPNSVIYQTLIHALSVNNRVSEAVKLLEEMFLMHCEPDVETFNDVIHGLCRAGRMQEAVKVLNRMLRGGFKGDALTYGFLMHGLCRMGKVDEATDLLNQIPNLNTTLYNTLINGYVSSGRFEEAKDLLYNSMIVAGYEPDAFTFNIMIDGLCKKGNLASALEFLNEIIMKGFDPNVITYTILINGFCKQGRLEEATEVVNSMSAKGLSLNTMGYNCLISALCKSGKIQDAIQMYGEMPIWILGFFVLNAEDDDEDH